MEYVFVLFHIVFFGIAPIAFVLWAFKRSKRKEAERTERIRKAAEEMAEEIRRQIEAERRRRQAYIDALLLHAMKEYQKPKKGVYWWDFLGVPKDASKEEINRAYKAKALVMHPDKGGSDKMMASLNKARELGLRGK